MAALASPPAMIQLSTSGNNPLVTVRRP